MTCTNGRTDILRQAVASYDPVDWDCIIFMYTQEPPTEVWTRSFPFCRITHEPGFRFGEFMQLITPQLVLERMYTHVTVHINDVQYRDGFNPSSIVALMQKLDLDVASPNIVGSSWPYMCREVLPIKVPSRGAGSTGDDDSLDTRGDDVVPPEQYLGHGRGRLVQSIEIQATTFTAEAWACWHEILNPQLNPLGWYDSCFYNYCSRPQKQRMAILNYTAVHWGIFPSYRGGVESTQSDIQPDPEWGFKYGTWLFNKWKTETGRLQNRTGMFDINIMGIKTPSSGRDICIPL